MQSIAIFVAYVLQTGLFFSLLFFVYNYGGKHAARRELSMPFFKPKICILYGNTVV